MVQEKGYGRIKMPGSSPKAGLTLKGRNIPGYHLLPIQGRSKILESGSRIPYTYTSIPFFLNLSRGCGDARNNKINQLNKPSIIDEV